MRKFLRKIVPKPIKKAIAFLLQLPRAVVNDCLDLYDSVTGRRNDLIPPRNMIYVGDGDFQELGNEFLGYIINLGKLPPNGSILDVGCGIGRIAIPLTRYLNKEGTYEGFDIVEKGIKWCKERITPRFPNFHFQISDVYNELYHPEGRFLAKEYKFPFADETFDTVVLVSVFTHMFPEDIENYLNEIARVLKKGGRSLISYFIINNESLKLIENGKSKFNFFDSGKGYFTNNTNNPCVAIGLDEEYIRKIHRSAGLKIEEPIHYGSWCGRQEFMSFQDFVVGIKE